MRRLLPSLSIASLYLAAQVVGAQSQVTVRDADGLVVGGQPPARSIRNHSELKVLWRDLRAAETMDQVRDPATRYGRFPWVFKGAVPIPGVDPYQEVTVVVLSIRRSQEAAALGDEAVLVDWEIQAPSALHRASTTVIRPGLR